MNLENRIELELQHRFDLWQRLQEYGGPAGVGPDIVRELGIYGGAQGIWVDKARTADLTGDGTGVTVGLLHTGRTYPDDLSSDGVLYHYPRTGRPLGRDVAEVNATKNAGAIGLPVFVISHSELASSKRDVRLAWVESWDDLSSIFLLTFGPNRLFARVFEDGSDVPFVVTSGNRGRRAEVEVRQGQQRFKFAVLHRYGPTCAVCQVQLLAIFGCSTLVPKAKMRI